MRQPPPCCSRCPRLRDGQCSLLADPSPANRRLLLSEACRVPDLLHRRFGPDVAQAALLRWIEVPGRDAADIVATYGARPRDESLWHGSWPYWNLARTQTKEELRWRARRLPLEAAGLSGSPGGGRELGGQAMDQERALDAVRALDPVDHAMLLDLLQGDFDGAAWAARLGCSGASVTNRKTLATYRLLVLAHDILGRIEPGAAAVVLRFRLFTPGVEDEGAAHHLARGSLGELPRATLRRLYREGATRSLELLAARDAVGPAPMASLEVALRRALRLDGTALPEPEPQGVEEAAPESQPPVSGVVCKARGGWKRAG